jgi:eukaryotic-like serine/threonine-protein kinase
MTVETAVRLFRTIAGKGDEPRGREKRAVRPRNPFGSQAPTRMLGGNRPARASGGGRLAADERVTRAAGNDRTALTGRTAAHDEAPVVLHRYRLRRRLGTGGFATVWLATDERLDREVAIKILPRERVVGGRFEREARAAARLAHPGIVTLFEAAVDDEGAYLVSELVHGRTLDRLLGEGRLSDRDVVQIGMALCDALMHAHANGVIHRDVKPSNVLIPERPTSPAGLARLTDFGVARVLGGDSLTVTGDVIGTVAYMAPEQAQGLPAGAPADLFSLALVLYEALTEVNPVRTQPGRRLGMHLPPLRRQRRDLPRELGQAVDLALRPRAGERGRLEELRGALTSVAGRVSDEPGVIAEPWRPKTKPRQAGGPTTDELHLRIEDHRRRADGEPPTPSVRPRQDDPPDETGEEFVQRHETFHIPWPRRALAGVAAAALGAWLARHAPGASLLPPALTACLAGVLVAALPRVGWLALTAFLATGLVTNAHAGGAVVLVAAALVPVVLAPWDAPAWPLAAAAPALGALGLAGAWPGFAGLAGSAWRRVALAATGWLWLALARGPWTDSPADTVHHVLAPLLTVGTLTGALAWAAAALVLPRVQSSRSPAREAILLAGWAAALAVATIAVVTPAAADPRISAGAAALGAFAGAVVALVTRRSWRRVRGAAWAKDCTPTA